VLIISPPALIAAKTQLATNPMITPKRKFKALHKSIGVPFGAGVGWIIPQTIIVIIKAKEILTKAGISLLEKTGAKRNIPARRKKTIIPVPNAVLISGQRIANCLRISSKINYLFEFFFFR